MDDQMIVILTSTRVFIMFVILVTNFLTVTKCDDADYHHMAYVIQWPPTLCGYPGINCKPINTFKFTIHGLWPGNSTGHSLICKPPLPHTQDSVNDVWEKDKELAKQLHDYWPTFLSGNTDEEFWMHEWEAHGYCTKEIVSAENYFRAAALVSKEKGKGKAINVLNKVRNGLAKANMLGANDDAAYDKGDIITAIQNGVGIKNMNIYISCTPKNVSYVYLKEIYFCLNKTTLKTFIDCPTSLDTRGCGGKTKNKNVMIPNRAIYTYKLPGAKRTG